jgi:hypothetical protein
VKNTLLYVQRQGETIYAEPAATVAENTPEER